MEQKEEKITNVMVSSKFVTALSIVSIVGFMGIVSQTIFNKDISYFVEALWMMIVGFALILEARIKILKSISNGIDSNNVSHLTTVIVGAVALVAGFFSLPWFRISNPSFLAIKGIISLIAIIVIAIQTWVIDMNHKEK